jgi:prevent-host-death family protein
MKALTVRHTKYGFGRLIDLARARPVAVVKHGCPLVVVMTVEDVGRLQAVDPKNHIRIQPEVGR